MIASFASVAQPTNKIGFLIRDKNDLSIKQAAQLAVQYANANGGYKGQDFQLITRSCDGPWGMTSKQAVAMIYEDQVPIVVTALDGRNAHLAEQVTAKSHVVMLSTMSSDPTLSRAYVPWYFRMVPDDKQQAEALVEQIYKKDGAKKVAVISLDDYDGKMSAEAFSEKAVEKGFTTPIVFSGLDEKQMMEKINDESWDAIVLAGSSDKANTQIRSIDDPRLYGFVNLCNFAGMILKDDNSRIGFPMSDDFDALKFKNFSTAYHIEFAEMPSISSVYIYDGILLAIEAIKKYGPDSESIRKGFKELNSHGITGQIEFDNLGDRDLNLLIEK